MMGKGIEMFPSACPGAPLVVVHCEPEEGRRVFEFARVLSGTDFAMAAIHDLDWAAELTPWPGRSAFRGSADYAGRADDYLKELTGGILPAVTARLPSDPVYVALAGYSLAGLFALYAPYKTAAFARVASASGSVWYPGFVDFAQTRAWMRRPERVYLSLGDRETRTRNAALRPVEDNTRALAALYADRGVSTIFELNPGGHFDEPDMRMARGVAWLVRASKS